MDINTFTMAIDGIGSVGAAGGPRCARGQGHRVRVSYGTRRRWNIMVMAWGAGRLAK